MSSSLSFPLSKTSVFLCNPIEIKPLGFSRLPNSACSTHGSSPWKVILKTNRLHNSVVVFGLVNKSIIEMVEQKTTLSPEEEPISDSFHRDSRFQVEELVRNIKALPSSQRSKYVENCELKTVSDFNDLLVALFISDELDLAIRLYSSLSSHDLAPDCWTHSIMVRCYCKQNEPSEAKLVVDHMFDKMLQPNVETCNVVIDKFCRGGRLQRAEEVLEIMGKYGIEQTIQTRNSFLRGLCYVGKVEKAYELLMNLKKSSEKPDICSYTVVMDGFCKVGRTDEAYELLDEAIQVGLTPNVATFNALFTGYWKEGRPLEGIGVLKQMKERNCKPNYISYNTLLHGLLKWSKLHESLLIYDEMMENGFRVDERLMNVLLRALCRKSATEGELLKDAYKVFERMTEWEYSVYDITYDPLIEALCRGGNADKALISLREMLGFKYVPKDITFDNVIRALCVEGKAESALGVLLMYRENGVPSRPAYNYLIDEFNREGRRLAACNVYGAALKQGIILLRRPKGC